MEVKARRTAAPGGGDPQPSTPRSAWRGLAASFRFAWDGVVETALHQRNMRIHMVSGILVALAGSVVRLGAAEDLALAFCVFLVLSAEVANSALEALVDLVTRERQDRARAAKDAGAGAVLVLAAGAVVVLAAVLLHAWPRIGAARDAALRQAALGLPLTGAAAVLLAPRKRPRAVDRALAAVGAALLVALALASANLVFTALAAALFAASAAAAGRRDRAPPQG